MRHYNSPLALCVIALFCTSANFSLAGLPKTAKPKVIESIVAKVGKKLILRSEIDVFLARQPFRNEKQQFSPQVKRRKALNFLIKEALINNECEKLGLAVQNDELQDAIQNVMANFKLIPAQFEQALIAQGYTLGSYKKNMHASLLKLKLMQRKIKSQVNISEQDIKAEYDLLFKDKKDDYKAHLHHIIFKTDKNSSKKQATESKKLAQKIAGITKNEKTFLEQAKKLGTQDNILSQDIGEVSRADITPDFAKPIFNAKVAQVVGPLKSPLGWHLVLVKAHVPIAVPKYVAMKEQIKASLFEREAIRIFDKYLKDLHTTTFLKVNNENNRVTK